MKKRFFILFLLLMLFPVTKIKALGVRYITHVQDIGWMNWVSNGEVSGTTGRAKRMEALYIQLDDYSIYNKIKYQTHVQDIGWMNWVNGGEMAGTNYQAKRMEAIRVMLDSSLTNQYSVYYRAHVQDIGWMNWVKNGEIAGTTGRAKRIEALQIKIVQNEGYVPPEPEPVPASEPESIVEPEPEIVYPHINYSIHTSNGWSDYGVDGETIGSIESPLSIDMIKVKLDNQTDMTAGMGVLTYTTEKGWTTLTGSDVQNGISGKGIEAIKIGLAEGIGNAYDIFYRVYVHKLGWLDWTKNGAVAGTKGYYYPIEAIEIKLQDKNNGELTVGANAYKETSTKLTYTSSINKTGWQKYVNNGEIVGTTGQGIQMEAIKLKLETGIDGNIVYKTYVSNMGWTDVVGNNTISGVENTNRKLEALEIALTGEMANIYDIYYRVHVSNIGWLDWTKNGERAGCLNTNQQIEALQLKLVLKGTEFKEKTTRPFMDGHWSEDKKTYIDGYGFIATGFRFIDGVKYFFNSDGILKGTNVKKVIDVSSWQDEIDWDTIKKDGEIDEVILRVGWGSIYDDPSGEDSQFARNIKAVQRLNIPYSIYIYAYAETYLGTENEAKFINDTLAKYGVPKDTFIWYDAEIYSIPKDVYTKIIPYFFKQLEKYGFNNYGIYAGVRQLDTTSGNLNDPILRNYPIWVAQYYKNLQYTGEYRGWQFSSTDYVHGINGNVDVSMFK